MISLDTRLSRVPRRLCVSFTGNAPRPTVLLCCVAMLLCGFAVLPHRCLADDEYSVQFTVPSDKQETWKFVELLSDKGYPAYMLTQDLGGGEIIYFAHMGTYASTDAARQAAEELQQKIRVDYRIVHAETNTPLGAPTVTAEVPPQAGDAVSDSTPPAVSVEQPEQTSEDKITRHEPAQPVMAPAKEPLPERTPTPQPQVVASVPEPLETEAVVETTVAPTPVPVSAGYTAPPAGSVFLVQLDSFSIKDNALKAARDHKNRGYAPIIILLYDDNHSPWYVLSLGHYPNRNAAAAAARDYRETERHTPVLNKVDADFLHSRMIPYD